MSPRRDWPIAGDHLELRGVVHRVVFANWFPIHPGAMKHGWRFRFHCDERNDRPHSRTNCKRTQSVLTCLGCVVDVWYRQSGVYGSYIRRTSRPYP